MKKEFSLSYNCAKDTWAVVDNESGEVMETFSYFFDAMAYRNFMEDSFSENKTRRGA